MQPHFFHIYGLRQIDKGLVIYLLTNKAISYGSDCFIMEIMVTTCGI